jgi:hypothetical protein
MTDTKVGKPLYHTIDHIAATIDNEPGDGCRETCYR